MNRRALVIFSAAVTGAMVVVAVWAWFQLPASAQIPIHWGADGQANGFAPKAVGLFLVPAITAGVAATFWAVPVLEPRRANIEKSWKAYTAIWLGTVVLLAGVFAVTIAAALGAAVDVTLLVLVGVGALFVVVGNYLPKVRPNYLIGIRTPWTLTSDLSWDRTHRLGGRLFVLEGVLLVIVGLIRPVPGAVAFVVIGAIAVLLVVVFGYSYRVWRNDPAKRPM